MDETGLLIHIGLISTDAYGTLRIEYQGADLETQTLDFYPEYAEFAGAYGSGAIGINVVKYLRPDPNSTAGLFYLDGFMGGWMGATWPYIPTIKMSLFLPNESTQQSAYIYAEGFAIAITNKKAFIESLRRTLDPQSSLKIDPALLVTGLAEFKEEEEKQ